jgi:hypothetical protein
MLKDGDISKQAKINPAKLKPADEAQLLVAQPDGKFKAISINGDATLSSDGTLTVAGSGQAPVVERNPALDEPELAEGQIAVGGATRSERVNLGTGSNAIPQRDSSGNLKAETADQATTATNADNATLLNGNNMEYYRNVANHVAETATTSTDSNNNDTSQQRTPHKVFEFDVPSDSGSYSAAGTGPSNYPIEFTHNCGYIPDISVYYKSNNAGASDPWEEVDAEVQNTTTTTKVQISAQNAHLKIVAK